MRRQRVSVWMAAMLAATQAIGVTLPVAAEDAGHGEIVGIWKDVESGEITFTFNEDQSGLWEKVGDESALRWKYDEGFEAYLVLAENGIQSVDIGEGEYGTTLSYHGYTLVAEADFEEAHAAYLVEQEAAEEVRRAEALERFITEYTEGRTVLSIGDSATVADGVTVTYRGLIPDENSRMPEGMQAVMLYLQVDNNSPLPYVLPEVRQYVLNSNSDNGVAQGTTWFQDREHWQEQIEAFSTATMVADFTLSAGQERTTTYNDGRTVTQMVGPVQYIVQFSLADTAFSILVDPSVDYSNAALAEGPAGEPGAAPEAVLVEDVLIREENYYVDAFGEKQNNRKREYTYDAAGHLLNEPDAWLPGFTIFWGGYDLTHEYDENGYRVRTTTYDTPGGDAIITYTNDESGRATHADIQTNMGFTGAWDYYYNEDGSLHALRNYGFVGGSGFSDRVDVEYYNYDENGRLISSVRQTEYFAGAGSGTYLVNEYAYNGEGQLVRRFQTSRSIYAADGSLSNDPTYYEYLYEYDETGRLVKETYADGNTLDEAGVVVMDAGRFPTITEYTYGDYVVR